MKQYLFLLLFLVSSICSFSQYTGLSASANNTRFCSTGSVIKVYGSAFANSNVSTGYHFVGMIYHFYYFNGSSINPIGNYTITTSSGSLVTSYFNINTVYFDGSQITQGQVVSQGYNSGSPRNGGFLQTSISVPWYAFPTSTGIQFYVAVEAIDNIGSTTVVSPRYAFDNPILYGNSVLNKPAISATKTILCGSDQSVLSTSPDLSSSFNYLWYKDGSVVLGQFGPTLTTTSTGTYNAYIYDGCQDVTTDNLVIKAGQVPDPPTITSDHGLLLCDGASANLSTTPSFGGDIHWNTSVTANSINVTTAGNFYAVETNSCGTSGNSNVITTTVGNKPVAPVIAPASDQLLCNGASVSLYSSGGNITWSNGATGNSMTTSTAGGYYTYDQNSCGNSDNSNVVNITTATCPPPVPGTSFQVCPGTLKTLDAGAGYDTYLWSNGATTQTIAVGPGNYTVTVTRQGCSATSNNVSVSYYTVTTPVITASGATTICAGTSVTLSSSVGASYAWSDGATSPNITVGSAGGYYVTVTDPNGCPSTSATINIVVHPLPTALVTGSTTICQNGATPLIMFTGNSATAPYTFSYQVNGGPVQNVSTVSGNSVSVAVPTNAAGSFTYQLLSVQESSSTACSNSVTGSATVVVNPLPAASISGSTFVCQNSIAPQIRFTGNLGTAPYTFTYRLNSGANQTIVSSGSSVTLDVPTNNPGTLTYTLVSVQDASSTACSNVASGTATVVINPLPTASIIGNATVCQNSGSPLVTFTGSTGVAPYTFNYQVNGGAPQSVTTTALSSSVTVAAPTIAPGGYTYSLLSVQEASITSCSNVAAGNVLITINQLPSASIAGTTTVCENSASPLISFSAAGGVAPYTFKYSINGGAIQTILTSSGNSVSVLAPTNTAGTFTYSLISVQDGSSTACLNAAAGTAKVIVNPQPTAAVLATPDNHLCNGSSGQITVFNYTPGFSYTWYKGGVLFKTTALDTIINNQAGSFTVLTTSDKGCDAASISTPLIITIGTVPTPVITGSLKVCPGGASKLLVVPPDTGQSFDSFLWRDSANKKTVGRDSLFSAYAGAYHLMVRAEGCYDSTMVTVLANDTEYPAGTLTITPNKIPYGGQVMLSANTTNSKSYSWDLGNGTQVVTDTNVLIQQYYKSGDSLKVTVQAISTRNCISAFTNSITVAARIMDSIPDMSFTGNLKDWNLYPVPFQDRLTVSVILKKNETVRMNLFGMDGRWMHAWEFKGTRGENLFYPDGLTTLPAGVVFVITAFYNGEKHFDKIYKY